MRMKVNKGISESIAILNFHISFKGKQYNIMNIMIFNCAVVIGIEVTITA
jgi:hypothetical protein